MKKNKAILKDFTQLPVSALTPRSSSIGRTPRGLVGVKEQLKEKGGGEPCMPFPFPVGVNIADRELYPLAPMMGLFCNWEGVSGSLRKFLAKGLRKSEFSLQPFCQLSVLDQEPGGLASIFDSFG